MLKAFSKYHLLSVILAIYACSTQKKEADIPTDGPSGMVWISGGKFMMGALDSDREARRDEYPAHEVELSGFWIDEHEITNAQFYEFVEATGYVTVAEKAPDWES